ncbi:MAG TPA: hypothetical protein PK760_08345, partial [Flavobacteriales bacterium]|nr:hypothetical protein [Flavobacteriales bacterium]
MRQLTTKQVAVSVGVVVALAAGALVALAERLAGLSVRPWYFVVVVVVLFGVAYFAFLFGIERFVHNRIKALYRTVHDLKRSSLELDAAVKGDGLSR